MRRSARRRTSNMSTCPSRFVEVISTSRKERSIVSAAPAPMAPSRRSKTRWALTSKASSTGPIVSADRNSSREPMLDFEALSNAIARQTVLCIGDLMLDEFVYGEVSRISPEAPAPVIAVQRSETNVGGAGNVARNIAALGGCCIFVGLVGDDEAGAKLRADLAQEERVEAVLVSDA